MKRNSIVIVMFSCLLVFAGCKNQEKKGEEGFRFQRDVKLSDIEITESFIYLFPSPGEVLDRFYGAELNYVGDLLHDPNRGDHYLSSTEKGLNLGVYLTDLAYAALFSRSSEAVEYLDVIQKLSSELNVSGAAFEELIGRTKENIGLRDSLVVISNEIFFNMVEFLELSDQESTIAVISCGSYVEALFLALNSVDEYDENDPVIRQISEFKYPIENLLKQAELVADDPGIKSLLKYINELNEIFSHLETESGTTTVSEPGVISFSEGKIPEITRGNFDEMKEKIISIRNNIVGN